MIPHSVLRHNLAGRDLTHYFAQLLNERGIVLTTSSEFEIVRSMKEELCTLLMISMQSSMQLRRGLRRHVRQWQVPMQTRRTSCPMGVLYQLAANAFDVRRHSSSPLSLERS